MLCLAIWGEDDSLKLTYCLCVWTAPCHCDIMTPGTQYLLQIIYRMDAEESEEPTPSPVRLGDYQVIRSRQNLLGKGGFGRVFKGKHIQTGDDVAVKEIEKNHRTNKFIKRELAFMKTCKHEHIVGLYDTKETKYSTFIIMEYCQSGNMNQFMHANEISFTKCMCFMTNVADAVGYLHCDKHICHRDLKPDNVLVTNNGQSAKLADFSLARIFAGSSSGATGTGVGTYGWLAPEVLKGSDATADDDNDDDDDHSRYSYPADISSLGLLYLAMLLALPGNTGLAPYTGMYVCMHLEARMEHILKHMSKWIRHCTRPDQI